MFVILKKHRSANCLFIHFFCPASLSILPATGIIAITRIIIITRFTVP